MQNKRWFFWLAVGLLFFVFLYLIRGILLPFVLGVFTAYFLDPAADKLEKWGLSRSLATIALTACFFIGIIALGVLVVPVLVDQLSGLIAAWPEYMQAISARYGPQLSFWLGDISKPPMESIQSAITDFSGIITKFIGEFIAGLFQSGMAVVTFISLFLITPVVSYYLLRDWDHIITRVDHLLPRAHAETIREQLRIVDRTLAGFLRGQLNVCLILSLFYAIGLSLTGLKFGIIIGLTTGFLVIFPYVGLMLGMATGLGVAFFQFSDYTSIASVLAVFALGQILEGNFITPKLVGEKVGLHPAWIIFGMLAGATLFGFVGVLLALPTTAVIGVLIRFMTERYLHSEYYTGQPQKP